MENKMKSEITIEDIITFLEGQQYNFSFVGEKEDKIEGYSTLFNYKNETLTFVSSLNNFSDYELDFIKRKIKLNIIFPREKIFPCFSNVIQIENPKSIFFLLLDHFFGKYHDESDDILIGNKETYNEKSYVSVQSIID